MIQDFVAINVDRAEINFPNVFTNCNACGLAHTFALRWDVKKADEIPFSIDSDE